MTKNELHRMIRWIEDESSMTGVHDDGFCRKLGEFKELLAEFYEFLFKEKYLRKRVVFDFDGVIHSYVSGWKGVDVIPDGPVPGIREVIDTLRMEYCYEVIVVSTRCVDTRGTEAIEERLAKHGIEVDGVQWRKPPAVAYVDDRGICFDGDARGLVDKVRHFRTYMEADGPRGVNEVIPGSEVLAGSLRENVMRKFTRQE